MRARYAGGVLLFVVGALPLTVAGLVMVSRAQRTALEEVRQGNHRVAISAAARLATFVEHQVDLLHTIAATTGPAVELAPEQATRIVKDYALIFPHLESVDVFAGPDCRALAGSGKSKCGDALVADALAGKTYLGDVHLTADFKDLMTIATPLEIAHERIGAVVADLDMIDIWDVVKSVRVGRTGRARLVGRDGTLIAHGDPEERRRVFLQNVPDPFLARIVAADPNHGTIYRNSQGVDVIALAAPVGDTGWTVIVEQPIAEAFREAHIMRVYLFVTVGISILLALLVGGFILRAPVVALEEMRKHANRVAKGDLDAKVHIDHRVEELRSLAVALNDMTAELKKLQEEIKSKERLSTFARVAAGLAHDLQLPIETIRGACDLIVQQPDEPGARELLRSAAEEHIPRLHRYVRDLRRLAHDGKIPLEYQAIDPRALAESVVRNASQSPKWRGIEFSAEGEAARIWGDESLLSRAIANLVGNGADACVMRRPPSGKVTVRVRDTDGGETLLVEVIDTGIGLAPDKLADLMVNDFRSDKRNSGVGLGLGVARHVAASHGGKITAESVQGEGTTFRIVLPRQSEAGLPAEKAS